MSGALRRSWALSWLALAACAEHALPVGPLCATDVFHAEIAFSHIDRVDLLLVVSNAPSMAEEQNALARELPALVAALLSGAVEPGMGAYPPLRDLHLGVVSADLGLDADGTLPGCSALGDDAALLQRGGAGSGCEQLPAFLSYRVPYPTRHPLIPPPDSAPAQAFIRDSACALRLGSSGCGVVQPLEASLRALWPVQLPERSSTVPEPPTFALPPQGDRANAGFLRDDPREGLSLLYVLVVSDGDDCSLRDPGGFAASANSASDPRVRCAQGQDSLLQSVERYVDGLRAVRTGNENLVEFGAITGIPEDRVPAVLDRDDEPRREAQYAALLADPRMQPMVREDGSLQPVCENEQASATPAPRLVETARRFGERAQLASICSKDWARTMALPLFDTIATQFGGSCLPRRPVRDPDGYAQCTVVWKLPLPGQALDHAPTSCSDLPFLRDARPRALTSDGHALCEVHQLAVTGLPNAPQLERGEGWFYDDFSAACGCRVGTCNSIFFTPNQPPSGVTIRLECSATRVLEPAAGAAPDDTSQCSVP